MFSTIGYYISVPFAWLLRQLYTLTGSYGMALILFTLVVKLVLLPFQLKSKKSMIRMNRFQPVMKELQARYANNPTKYNEEIQKLYREEGISPMGGCLWSFLPLPIMIALYSIIRMPLSRFMMLSEEVITEIRTLATSLGYVVSTGMGGKTDFYEEIHLTNFIANHTESFIGQFDGETFTWFEGRRIDNPNTHGTGCTLSSAIAANLAKGQPLHDAVENAKAYISGALGAMLDLGKGSGPMNHAFAVEGRFAK